MKKEICTNSMDKIHPHYHLQKGDRQTYANYRRMSLIPHLSKVLLNILLDRMHGQMEPHLFEEQACFRTGKSTTQQILGLRFSAKISNLFKDISYHASSSVVVGDELGKIWNAHKRGQNEVNNLQTFIKKNCNTPAVSTLKNNPIERVKSSA